MVDTDNDDRKAADAKELHRTVREDGEDELGRPAMSLFWSGLAAGLAINASLLTEGALHLGLPEAPWRELLVSLGYPVGFMIVILGRMQFFTESTITAVLPLVTTPSSAALYRTLRIWGIVLGANLLGTLIAAASVSYGLVGSAELHAAMTAISAKILELSPGETFVNAIPAGFLIAIVAWALPNAREQSVLVIFVIVFLVAIGGFSHSVVGSLEAFLLMWDGRVDAGQVAWGLIAPAVAGNLVGGGGIFALLAHGQVHGETKERSDG